VTSLYLQVSIVRSHVPFEHTNVPHFTSNDYCYHHRATLEILYLQQHKEQYRKKTDQVCNPSS